METVVEMINGLDKGYYHVSKNISLEEGIYRVEYTMYKNYKKYFGMMAEDNDLENALDTLEKEFVTILKEYYRYFGGVQMLRDEEVVSVDETNLQGMTVEKYLDYMRKGINPYTDIATEGNNSLDTLITDAVNYTRKLSSLIRETFPEIFEEGSKWEITKEDNESTKEQLESTEAGRYKPMYDTKDVGNEIDFTGEEVVAIEKDPTIIVQGHVLQDEILDEQEATLSPSYIEKNSPLLGWVTDDTLSVGKLATSEKNSSIMLVEKIVTDIMNKLITEGSCTIDIKLKENNQ